MAVANAEQPFLLPVRQVEFDNQIVGSPMDPFKLMETYSVVVKLGSYTRAAKELGVTRAMVSKRLQDLEAALGLKLLNRNTRRLSPTGAGQDYFDACATILAAVHS